MTTKVAFKAQRAGFISSMNTREIGVAGNLLGAGRMKTSDIVDPAVGFEVHRKVGDAVSAGDDVLTIHHRDGRALEACQKLLSQAIVVGDAPVKPLELILDRVG
ncbi:hypothetical protein HZA57_08760 [Candidatus Poribacteria bacterium]|nr:hypothetical protein [Candidatus Poribacteria bacterium]